jgi:hypothetical protein
MVRPDTRHLRTALNQHAGRIKEVDEEIVTWPVPSRSVGKLLTESIEVVADSLEVLEAGESEGIVGEADLRRANKRDSMVNLLAAKPHAVVSYLVRELESEPIDKEPRHGGESADVERNMLAALGADANDPWRERGGWIGRHPVKQLEAVAAWSLDQR